MQRTYATSLIVLVMFIAGCAQTRPVDYRFDTSYGVADPQFARTVGNLLGSALIPGNSITTLVNGDQIFPAMLDAIHAARTSITFETYVYWSGPVGRTFAEALAERASAGVKVLVLLDWFGAQQIDPKDYELMQKSGVLIHRYHVFHFYDPFSYWQIDHRTHRKLLVVDGKVGFTGGVGIADMWAGEAQDSHHWRDNHYRIEGPVVAQLQAAFADNWMQTTGEVLDGESYFPPLTQAGGELAQVFKSSPQGGSDTMQLLVLLAISHAARSIRIESAYFLPDKLTQKMLVNAAQRGVKVEIIVPGREIDEKEVRLASRASWGRLLKADGKSGGGIAIYEYQPTMDHCKVLIVDDLWTSIGSANMDNRSFRINDEANLNVLDARFAAQQVQLFDMDKARSRRITYERWQHRPLLEKLTAPFPSILSPEM